MVRVYAHPVRLAALFLGMLAMLVATIALPSVANAQTTDSVVVPVHGKVYNKSGKAVGTFEGQVTDPVVSYVKTKAYKGLKVTGHLTGTLTRADNSTENVDKQFTTRAVVRQAQNACQILNLDIGRIHLNLLGLVVDLAPIHLDVTAVPGQGNLLGNLLCAVAGLLDPNSALATFLNNLLGALFRQTA